MPQSLLQCPCLHVVSRIWAISLLIWSGQFAQHYCRVLPAFDLLFRPSLRLPTGSYPALISKALLSSFIKEEGRGP